MSDASFLMCSIARVVLKARGGCGAGSSVVVEESVVGARVVEVAVATVAAVLEVSLEGAPANHEVVVDAEVIDTVESVDAGREVVPVPVAPVQAAHRTTTSTKATMSVPAANLRIPRSLKSGLSIPEV